jgi:hypothetical protein
MAQLPKDPEERAKAIAQMMAANATELTLFDREGKHACVISLTVVPEGMAFMQVGLTCVSFSVVIDPQPSGGRHA